jgi:hypothetical protein
MQTYPFSKKRRSLVIAILGHANTLLAEIGAHTQSLRSKLIADMGGCQDLRLNLPLIAMGFDPEPIGIAHVYNRMPYTNPELIKNNISTSVAQGWLMVDREGVYRATDKTRVFHASLCQNLDRAYTRMKSLPNLQLTWMNDLLQRVVESISEEKDLFFRPFFDLDIKLAASHASMLQKVCSQLSHIRAYREDTYLNAWMDQEVNGYVWDAFSCIYKKSARTVESISVALGPRRYYTAEVYKHAIDELTSRDWIRPTNGKYEPTVRGLQVLADVIFTMNQYFLAPWDCLDHKEILCLCGQSEILADSLKFDSREQDRGRLHLRPGFGLGSARWAGISIT